MFALLSTLASGYPLLSGSTAHVPEDMAVLAHCLAAGCRLSLTRHLASSCASSPRWPSVSTVAPLLCLWPWPLIILYAVKTFWGLWEINMPFTVNRGSY